MLIAAYANHKIEYQGPAGEYQIKDQGYRVYKKSYHTHRGGAKIQRPRSKQLPRWKLVGVFETEEEAIAYVEEVEAVRKEGV